MSKRVGRERDHGRARSRSRSRSRTRRHDERRRSSDRWSSGQKKQSSDKSSDRDHDFRDRKNYSSDSYRRVTPTKSEAPPSGHAGTTVPFGHSENVARAGQWITYYPPPYPSYQPVQPPMNYHPHTVQQLATHPPLVHLPETPPQMVMVVDQKGEPHLYSVPVTDWNRMARQVKHATKCVQDECTDDTHNVLPTRTEDVQSLLRRFVCPNALVIHEPRVSDEPSGTTCLATQ